MNTRTTGSQFLAELPSEEIEWDLQREEKSFRDKADFQRPGRGDYRDWKNGMYLRHPQFGLGRLLWKQSSGEFTRAGVRFTSYGEKTLILEYAKMTPLDVDECQL